MNKLGRKEDYLTPKEFKEFIKESIGEFPALINNDLIILIENFGNDYYNIAIRENEFIDYRNIDKMFNDKIILGKALNDFEQIDLAVY